MVARDGRKMSKSLGNGEAVARVLERHGAEIVQREFVQERLSTCAINLYVGFACASRLLEFPWSYVFSLGSKREMISLLYINLHRI